MKLVSSQKKQLKTMDQQLAKFLNPMREFDDASQKRSSTGEATPSKVSIAVQTLGKLESEVIAALFPPCGAPPATMEEISKDLGMTVEEVRNIADEALRGLRGLRAGPPRISKAWN